MSFEIVRLCRPLVSVHGSIRPSFSWKFPNSYSAKQRLIHFHEGRIRLLFQFILLFFQRSNPFADARVFDVRRDPGGQWTSDLRGFRSVLRRERIRLLSQQLFDRLSILHGDVARIEIHDFLFHTTFAEEAEGTRKSRLDTEAKRSLTLSSMSMMYRVHPSVSAHPRECL